MQNTLRFALNHMVAPKISAEALFRTARRLGAEGVEIRNDLPGSAIADGTTASDIRAAVAAHGILLLSINALQRFNDWTPERAEEAEWLSDYASACGAEALVLCPVNDPSDIVSGHAQIHRLQFALAALRPILADRQIVGLVEPLGFATSSLRRKRDAVEAIEATGGGTIFRLVHDTFHHEIAGETEIFARQTGLVHISGVEERNVSLSSMRDSHRVLVGPQDRLKNIDQIKSLLDGGYSGFLSFEPFAENLHAITDIDPRIRESIAYLKAALE